VLSKEDLNPSKKEKKKGKKRNFTQVKTFLETVAPDKVFSKTFSFRNISKTVLDM